LLKQDNKEYMLKEVYDKCKTAFREGTSKEKNYVKELYDLYTDDEISDKISEIVKPKHIFSEVQVIFQSVEELNLACPNNLGDWYFTGNYPTPGGNKVVNKSFIYFMEGINKRAY
ncbi:MAG: amidophosphoribosyltransferase, partial [Bacteroidetes bacterium]|nr:amidophosphoribosyltransferase [Confluentibacter sp.]MCB0540964.1 amidophosphoribosyltransferase [Bacteroidota bacterium]